VPGAGCAAAASWAHDARLPLTAVLPLGAGRRCAGAAAQTFIRTAAGVNGRITSIFDDLRLSQEVLGVAWRPMSRARSALDLPRCDTPAQRLGWLDALRGIAALCVVFEHLSFDTLKPVRHHVIPWFSPGLYGVMVFFLVSGYIVPASLERRGSVRGFWIGRVFRLYPMWLAAIAAAIVLNRFRLYAFPASATSHPATTALAHAFMLQDLLGVLNVINVLWTLSYEMAFYLLITLLFVAGAHHRSARIGVGFAVTAVAFGGILPKVALSHRLSDARTVALAASIAIIAGLAGVVSGRGRIRTAGAVLAGGTPWCSCCSTAAHRPGRDSRSSRPCSRAPRYTGPRAGRRRGQRRSRRRSRSAASASSAASGMCTSGE
jgi:Acyltransferase family